MKYAFFLLFCILLIISCVTHYKTTESRSAVVKHQDSFENGKNLVLNICGQCHYDTTARSYIGKRMGDLPRFMGAVYSANLTKSESHGSTVHYSDPELAYLLKTGVARDGRFIPYMIRPNLAEEDINDILVYLRSDDPPVKAADTVPGMTKLKLLGKIAIRITQAPLTYTITPKPDKADVSAYGRYLVDNLACYHCHSERIPGLNYTEPEKSQGYMQGGMEFRYNGGLIYASNLTPDTLTGIGSYNLPQFIRIMRYGVLPSGKRLRPPMQKFPGLTDAQLRAIFIYLKILPPKEHLIRKN